MVVVKLSTVILMMCSLSLAAVMQFRISDQKCSEYRRLRAKPSGIVWIDQGTSCPATLISERFLLISGSCEVDFTEPLVIANSIREGQGAIYHDVKGFTSSANLGLILVDIKQGIDGMDTYVDCIPNSSEMSDSKLKWIENTVWPKGKTAKCKDDCATLIVTGTHGVL